MEKDWAIFMLKCDPRAFARCPYNRSCVTPEQAEFTEGSDCDRFNKKILEKPPTNADRIRMMDDRELASFLQAITGACAERACDRCPIGHPNCVTMIYWVRQPEGG